MASFILAALIVMSLGVASGLAHGLLDGRWAAQPDLQAIGGRLRQLPPRLGDWVVLEEHELADSSQKLLHCYGYVYRTYQNSKTSSRVNMVVLFGPRGPIAVHTPEICYSSQGVAPRQQRQDMAVEANGQTHKLWNVEFLSKASKEPEFQVIYGWSDGGTWQASERPRFWLTDRLYKIQMSGPPDDPGIPSECRQFLELLLPELDGLIEPGRASLDDH
jgi:hypothetical protein